MAAGSAFTSLLPLAVTLAGLVAIVRGRLARGRDVPPEDTARRDSAAEMERRMAAYLTARDSDRRPAGPNDRIE